MNYTTATVLVRHHIDTLRRTGCLPSCYASLSPAGQLTELREQITRWVARDTIPLKVIRLYCDPSLPRLKTFEAWEAKHTSYAIFFALGTCEHHLSQLSDALDLLISHPTLEGDI